MRKYIYIGCGGFIGAVLRYLAEGVQIFNYHEDIPLNTLLINVAGSFIIAFIITIAFGALAFDPNVRLGVTTGLLGAFTTFSTLCKETVALLHDGDYFSAISYMTVSIMLGLCAVYFGVVVAREIGLKLTYNNTDMKNPAEDEGEAD